MNVGATETSLYTSKLKIVETNIMHNLKLNHAAFFKKQIFWSNVAQVGCKN